MWKLILFFVIAIAVSGTIGYMWIKSECHRYTLNSTYPIETCGKYLKDTNCLEEVPGYISHFCQLRLREDNILNNF